MPKVDVNKIEENNKPINIVEFILYLNDQSQDQQ